MLVSLRRDRATSVTAPGVMQRRDPRCRRHCSWCKRAAARPALRGFRSACVSSHAGDTRPRCWSGRRALVSSSGARPLHRRGGARVGAARSRCRGAAALLPEAKHQPRPSDPVLAHLRADDREQAVPHTHRAPRAEHGSNSQELPRRADAISKACVRRLDTGRVVCHGRERQRRPMLTIASTIRATRAGRSPPTDRERREPAPRRKRRGLRLGRSLLAQPISAPDGANSLPEAGGAYARGPRPQSVTAVPLLAKSSNQTSWPVAPCFGDGGGIRAFASTPRGSVVLRRHTSRSFCLETG